MKYQDLKQVDNIKESLSDIIKKVDKMRNDKRLTRKLTYVELLDLDWLKSYLNTVNQEVIRLDKNRKEILKELYSFRKEYRNLESI